jgi:protein DEK
MATDAKPASPAPEDPPADDPMEDKAESEAEGEEEQEQDGDEEEEEEPQPKKRARRRRLSGEERALASPAPERPSRERKTVERYAELTPRSTPAKKTTAILQVRSFSSLTPPLAIPRARCCSRSVVSRSIAGTESLTVDRCL